MKKITELLIATGNAGKLREFITLLGASQVILRSLADFPGVPEADEPHRTFHDNALAKARFYSGRTGLIALADDSGLEVEALGGAPGVHSARFGGAQLSSEERTRLLLRDLARTGDTLRCARFACAIALSHPVSGATEATVGYCTGRIAESPRGANGFGYDPVFIPEGFAQTFAEMDAHIKDRISHRAQAMREVPTLLFKLIADRQHPAS